MREYRVETLSTVPREPVGKSKLPSWTALGRARLVPGRQRGTTGATNRHEPQDKDARVQVEQILHEQRAESDAPIRNRELREGKKKETVRWKGDGLTLGCISCVTRACR